jgi:hypothetical protein
VYLEKAHVDCAAFWVVVHRVLLVEARRLCGYGFVERAGLLQRSCFGVDGDVLVGTRAGVNHRSSLMGELMESPKYARPKTTRSAGVVCATVATLLSVEVVQVRAQDWHDRLHASVEHKNCQCMYEEWSRV